MDHAEQRTSNEVAALEAKAFQRCRVAPLEVSLCINRIDRFARTLENVRQQRLVLACDSLYLAQLGKIACGTHNRDRLIVFIQHRLNRNQQRAIQTTRSDLYRHTAPRLECVFDNTCVGFFAGSEYVAALATEQQPRVNSFHRSARTIHAFQFAGTVEDEDAVRHRVESCFPLGLSARHHLKQLSLRDADGQSFRERLHQTQLIFRPETFSIRLMDGKNATKLSLHDQWVVDRRADLEFLRLRANVVAQRRRLAFIVQTIVDNQWLVGAGKLARNKMVVIDVNALDAFHTFVEKFVFEWGTDAFAVQQE